MKTLCRREERKEMLGQPRAPRLDCCCYGTKTASAVVVAAAAVVVVAAVGLEFPTS